jgi:hypothetical protein
MPQTAKKKWSRGLSFLVLCGLSLLSTQLRCASADNYHPDDEDPSFLDGGQKKKDMIDSPCVTGVPQTEVELFNRCTDADRVTRGSKIPASLWDGQSPLPYEK